MYQLLELISQYLSIGILIGVSAGRYWKGFVSKVLAHSWASPIASIKEVFILSIRNKYSEVSFSSRGHYKFASGIPHHIFLSCSLTLRLSISRMSSWSGSSSCNRAATWGFSRIKASRVVRAVARRLSSLLNLKMLSGARLTH